MNDHENKVCDKLVGLLLSVEGKCMSRPEAERIAFRDIKLFLKREIVNIEKEKLAPKA